LGTIKLFFFSISVSKTFIFSGNTDLDETNILVILLSIIFFRNGSTKRNH
jgi:hypothetical protein